MLRVLSIPGRQHENRFFALLADALEAEGVTPIPPTMRNTATFAYDTLHLNFPTHYITENNAVRAFALSLLLGSYLIMAKLLGRRIIYTVHDVVPFRTRHRALSHAFLRLTHRLTNLFVFLSASSRAEFVRIYPGDSKRPWVLTRHGPYPATRLTEAERARRRNGLVGADTDVLVGFLGNIKPYKNIAALDGLPTCLPDGRAVRVVVAGRIEPGHEAAAQAVIDRRPPGSLSRIDEQLTDEALDALIQTVDLVLLPYTKGSNSGVALLVLSNGGRLIGSDLPVFQELAASVGAPWAYSFSAAGTPLPNLARTIEQAMTRAVTADDVAALHRYLDQVSFQAAAVSLKQSL